MATPAIIPQLPLQTVLVDDSKKVSSIWGMFFVNLVAQVRAQPKLIGRAVFSCSAGVLTVHYQQGLVLTRAAAGNFNIVFNQVQSNAFFTVAMNHCRYTTWTNTGEQVDLQTVNGCRMLFMEAGTPTDPAPYPSQHSSVMIWST